MPQATSSSDAFRRAAIGASLLFGGVVAGWLFLPRAHRIGPEWVEPFLILGGGGIIFVTVVCGLAMLVTANSRGTSSTERVLCPDCGYDLRGRHDAMCPECGGRFTVDQLTREP